MNKHRNMIVRSAPVLGAVALLAVIQMASAQTAINLDTALNPAVDTVCATIRDLGKSVFLSIIALVMFVGGLGMMWLKVRGGMGLAITGFIGYFLIKQALSIAISLKIVDPKKCSAT